MNVVKIPIVIGRNRLRGTAEGAMVFDGFGQDNLETLRSLMRTLTEAGLIEAIPFGHIDSGFVRVPVHKLTPQGQVAVAAQLGKEMARG